MSLDVYLNSNTTVTPNSESKIFIRESGQTKEISSDEWEDRFPGIEEMIKSIVYFLLPLILVCHGIAISDLIPAIIGAFILGYSTADMIIKGVENV